MLQLSGFRPLHVRWFPVRDGLLGIPEDFLQQRDLSCPQWLWSFFGKMRTLSAEERGQHMCIEKNLQFPFLCRRTFYFFVSVRRETCRRNNTELSCYCSVLNCTGFVCLLSAPSLLSWAYPITVQCSSVNSCLGRYCELWRGMLGYISIKMFKIKAYSVILLWRWKTIQQKITF